MLACLNLPTIQFKSVHFNGLYDIPVDHYIEAVEWAVRERG
jgi:hypothetical protein